MGLDLTSNKWKKFKLDEVYDIRSGLSKKSDQFGFGHDFLGFKEVFNNFFLPKELSELVNSTNQERERASIIRGDVFLTRTSETQHELGMSSVALKDYPNATFNGFTKRLRPNGNSDILPEYAGYYFRSPNFRNQVTSMSVLTTRASLNNSMLSNLTIDVPPMEIQESISNILMSIDYKIENNNVIIANLEEQAQVIFKSWFIDFDSFKKKEFTDSELGSIPIGWQVNSLDNIATFKNGLAMQKFRPETEQDSLPVLKIKELRANKTDSSSDRCAVDIPKEVLIENGDIIFSWSGSLLVEVWTGGTAGLNQHLFKVSSNKYNKWFYYYWTKFFLNQFVAIARDRATTMGHIKRSHLKEAKVLIPDDVTLGEMDKVMDPIVSKKINLGVQNKKLEELRDTLLPKLMSGEIQVEEAVENE